LNNKSLTYTCSQCGLIMNEFKGVCPRCGVYLYVDHSGANKKSSQSNKVQIRDGCIKLTVAVVCYYICIYMSGLVKNMEESILMYIYGIIGVICIFTTLIIGIGGLIDLIFGIKGLLSEE
jgi:hypothetical protein